MKNKTPNSLSAARAKYIKKHCTDRWQITAGNSADIKAVIVIPALAEYKNIQVLLESLILNDPSAFTSTLILFVVNNLESSDQDIKHQNQKTIEFLNLLQNNSRTTEVLINKIRASGIRTAYVDASSPGYELPEKEGGVGLARKVGMDLALQLFDFEIECNYIIGCLDSDCIVPTNYLNKIFKLTSDNSFKAGYVNYEHPLTDPGTIDAIICYEIFLHYYVAGLKYACSPYAFHTIGSTMMCSAEAYISIGGMNKRKAAEDFYFMEKLSKNYIIKKIEGTSIYPSSRVSFRVPFGTGQRVNRFLQHLQNEYLLYAPESFTILKKWLSVFNNHNILTADEYLKQAKEINISLYNFLVSNNFKADWERILNNSKQSAQIQKQKQFWFDGFRTLKLIHYLRDTQFPPTAMFKALDEMFSFFDVENEFRSMEELPDIETQKKYLQLLRSIA